MSDAAKALAGKSAIITGSTSGIGLGVAEGLAAAGCHVMLNGFGDAAQIEADRARVAATFGVKALYSGADMSKPDQITAMFAEAEAAFGKVDIVVNNAGIQFVSKVEEFPAAKWDAIIAINLSSAFHLTRAAVPGMKARNWGRVVNVASAHGLVASPFKSAYVASKHGIVGFTKSIALELAELNITANTICPGYVRTPLVEGQIEDQMKAHNMGREQVIRDVLLGSQPNKRFAEVSEIAAVAVFLCSESASSITGTAISVDGGWTAR